MDPQRLARILEAAIFAADEPLGIDRMLALFPDCLLYTSPSPRDS